MHIHVITGASAGMGRATALALARRGESVLAIARRPDELRRLVEEAGDCVEPLVGDVADPATIERVTDAVQQRTVASLVHGAATPVGLAPWTDLDAAELTDQFRVHVAAPIALTHTLLARGPVERVIIFDSFSATTPRDGWAAYSILKAGVQMAFRAATVELDGVAVVRAFPGAVDTPLLRRVLEAPDAIPATAFYRELAESGKVSDPAVIGESLATLILETPLSELSARQEWHIGHGI